MSLFVLGDSALSIHLRLKLLNAAEEWVGTAWCQRYFLSTDIPLLPLGRMKDGSVTALFEFKCLNPEKHLHKANPLNLIINFNITSILLFLLVSTDTLQKKRLGSKSLLEFFQHVFCQLSAQMRRFSPGNPTVQKHGTWVERLPCSPGWVKQLDKMPPCLLSMFFLC